MQPASSTAGTPTPADFVSSQPAALQPYFQQLYREGERNAVVNFDRLGVAALADHDYDIAKEAFDQAILRIDAFRTGGSDLNAAKSKFQNEASKDFKGEPYERALTFYYRGLVYLHDGDFSNAGASFARANVEDSQAEGERSQADYASMKFLNAWALGCQGDRSTSSDLNAQAIAMRSEMGALDYQHPVVVIVETGLGPRKVGTGQYKEKLSWEETGDDSGKVEVTLAGATVASPVRAESLYYQASTRGGRPVEYLLAGKAKFKEAAKTTSDVSSAVALGAVQVANMQAAAGQYNQALTSDYIAMGSAVFSMFSKIAENSTKPAADTRTWESIPGSIWLATTAAPRASRASDVSVLVDGRAHQPDLIGTVGSCTAVWFRASAVPAPHAAAAEKIDSTAEAKARLKIFQGKLPSMF
jgi:tetratricopeptide (TPR) repeat protein